MDRSSELRLPTVAVPVRLALVGHTPIDVELFAPDVARVGRSQLLDDLADMLDHEDGFVPVRAGDGVRLYGKHAIAWIAVHRRELELQRQRADDFDEIPSEVVTLYDRHHRVDVVLATGETLTGMLFDSSPADRPRVIDHLNRARRFLRLWTQDEHYLINTHEIVRVTELPWNLE
jgi:hypothetical protein